MTEPIKSPDNAVPDVDLNKFDLITSLVATFEAQDLKTTNALNFYYDKSHDYVFLEVQATVNNNKAADYVFGFDKEKVFSVCKNIVDYFSKDDLDLLLKFFQSKKT